MTYTTKKLKSLWNEEKEHYRKKEIGTGVQSFVKKVLESDEIFKLKEGKLSTKLQDRKNEFIHEKKAKQQRRADFYIFISPEIAIPVEAEQYGNIQIGESQLFKYQKDFEKQYGILTDGFSWRFYNNNLYRTFTLDDILDNTSLFLTFWKEYIKPEGYYLSFFEKIGQLALTEEKILHVEDYRQSFFEDITKLIQSFKNKLQIEGYLEDTEDKSKEQRAIELTYAYIIQFILYKTLVDNEFDEFPQEFETLVGTIHKSLKKKAYKNILGVINGISDTISKNIYRPFDKEQEFINKRIFELLRSLKNTLNDVSPWLDIFVFIKKYNFANVRNEIFGFIYENYLKELYEEGQKGQYFTDPAVVNFMLKQIGYTPAWVKKRYELDKDSISLIDPACGSGTFLYAATNVIVQAFKDGYTEEASKKIEEAITSSIFGLDIEEFPLYLAEMSILMRLLPLIIHQKYNNPIDKKIKVFKTRDSVSEFMDTALRNTLSDMRVKFEKAAGSPGQIPMFTKKLDLGYRSYVRDEDDLKEMKQSLENQQKIPRRRFDYVIGNPPYISYNQCSRQGVLIVKLIQSGKCAMNDIYGVNLNTVPEHTKPYAPKPNLYAFFIALGLALLKDDGTLSYIIPQTVLVNTDLDVIRYHLSKFVTIEKIISFRGKMFIGRGLRQKTPVATSSLIFVVRKKPPVATHRVSVINHTRRDGDIEEALKDINSNKRISKKTIFQTEFLRRVDNWNFIKWNRTEAELIKKYFENSESLDIYRDYDISREKFNDIFIIDGSINILKKDVQEKIQDSPQNHYKIFNFDKTYKMKLVGYYPKNKKIKIAKGSQGLKVIKPKHKVFWKYINHDRFCYASGEDVIPIYQQYCIASDNEKEILYLLSLLNSPLIDFVLGKNLKIANEDKLSLLLGVRVVKRFVRVPKITKGNQFIKNRVIELTEELLELEKAILADLVDFSGVMAQKFDSASVEGNYLVLKRGKRETKLPIKKDEGLVKKIVGGESEELKLDFEGKVILLSELMSVQVINFEKQRTIKDYIDDLVFALYFNIDIPKSKLNKPETIKKLCQKNKFYKTIQNED